MSSRRSETEQQVAALCLITFAAFLLAMILLEAIMIASFPERSTLLSDFIRKSNSSLMIGMFLAWLIVGSIGFIGTVGLIRTYGAGASGLLVDATQLATVATFLAKYWLWSAMGIVQHKITLRTDTPTNPPDDLLRIFDSSDAYWSLLGWGSLGPQLLLYAGLALLLLRGARRLPRVAAWLFAALAASQLLILLYSGLRGMSWHSSWSFDFAMLNDLFATFGQVVAYMLAGVAVFTEKGIFARGRTR